MSTASTAPHLEDYQLLHLVDRDADNFELDQWSKHALACEECSTRLSRVGAQSAAVMAAISDVQLPAGFRLPELPEISAHPTRRWGPAARNPWLRAAAILIVLLAPFLFVHPLRAWVIEQISSAWSTLRLDADQPAPDESGPGIGGSSTILFGSGATELTITIANRQAAGELLVTPGRVEEVSLRVLGGGAETPLVTGSGVQIDNAPASTASYAISLPPSVRRLTVRVGDETVRTFTGPVDGSVTIDLAAEGR